MKQVAKIIGIAAVSGAAATLGGLAITHLLKTRFSPQADHATLLGVGVGAELGQVREVFSRYDSDLRQLGGRVGRLEGAFDAFGGRLGSLEGRVAALEGRGGAFNAPQRALGPPQSPRNWVNGGNGVSSGEEIDAAVRRFQLLELD